LILIAWHSRAIKRVKMGGQNDAVSNNLDCCRCLPARLVALSPVPQVTEPVFRDVCLTEADLTGYHFRLPQTKCEKYGLFERKLLYRQKGYDIKELRACRSASNLIV
jgi:hypothetical protein